MALSSGVRHTRRREERGVGRRKKAGK